MMGDDGGCHLTPAPHHTAPVSLPVPRGRCVGKHRRDGDRSWRCGSGLDRGGGAMPCCATKPRRRAR